MPNWCSDKLTITGPEADRTAFLARAGDTLDFNLWSPYPEEFRKLDEAAREWDKANRDKDGHMLNGVKIEDRPKDGFNQGGYEWRLNNWHSKWNASTFDAAFKAPHFIVGNECITCDFETPFTPPFAIVQLMSLMFPDITLVLEYSVEMMWDAGKWELANGNGFLREHQVGWFRTAKDDEPIHHYVSGFDVEDAKIKELIAAKILFRPETARHRNEFAFRCAPSELGVEYGQPNSWTLNYTLDEEIYLDSCYNRAGQAAVWGGHVLEGGAILCNCPLKLTEQEIDWLRASRVSGEDDDSNKYRNRQRTLRQEMFANFGAQYGYPTNRQELTLLLTCPDLTGERRKEIEEAMLKPRWKVAWPQWREMMVVPPQPLNESVDDDFMAELERL
jgi:hypothetical protein